MLSHTSTPEVKPSHHLIGLTLEDLKSEAEECGLPRFAAGQIAKWLYGKRATSLDQMTDISKHGRERLSKAGYSVGREAPLSEARSIDGTVKYLFPGAPGRDVESVYIPDRDRATICVSSQAGCKMNCSFCMTGRQGFHGNLSCAQIINQVLSIPESEALTNLVFMGMGEPMDNLDPVLKTIDILTAKWGWHGVRNESPSAPLANFASCSGYSTRPKCMWPSPSTRHSAKNALP